MENAKGRDYNAQSRIKELRYALAKQGLTLDDLREAIDGGLVTIEALKRLRTAEQAKVSLVMSMDDARENAARLNVCRIPMNAVMNTPHIDPDNLQNTDIAYLKEAFGLEEAPYTREEIYRMAIDEQFPGVSLMNVHRWPLGGIGVVLTSDGVLLDGIVSDSWVHLAENAFSDIISQQESGHLSHALNPFPFVEDIHSDPLAFDGERFNVQRLQEHYELERSVYTAEELEDLVNDDAVERIFRDEAGENQLPGLPGLVLTADGVLYECRLIKNGFAIGDRLES